MTEKRSTQDFSDDEIKFELSLRGEGMESFDHYEQFLTARQTFHDVVADLMRGDGESTEANRQYAEQLLVETSQTFARLIQATSEGEQQPMISLLMAQSIDVLNDAVASFETPITAVEQNVEGLVELADGILVMDDLDEQATELESLFGETHNYVIDNLLQYAAENKCDIRKQRRDRLVGQTRKVAGEVGKVALGAAVAVVATRFLNNRR